MNDAAQTLSRFLNVSQLHECVIPPGPVSRTERPGGICGGVLSCRTIAARVFRGEVRARQNTRHQCSELVKSAPLGAGSGLIREQAWHSAFVWLWHRCEIYRCQTIELRTMELMRLRGAL